MLGAITTDGGEVQRVLDPVTGRSVDLAIPYVQTGDVQWTSPAHTALVASSHDGDQELLFLFDFPSGKWRAGATAKGSVIELKLAADGSAIGWSELRGAAPNQRCGAGAITIADAHVISTAPYPCRHEEYEPMNALVSIDGAAMSLLAATDVRFDVHTGARLPVPPRRAAKTDDTQVDRAAFAPEIKRALAARPDYAALSPLFLDTAILEAKHGYEVIEFGNAHTVLTRRGEAYSLCDTAHGDACRHVFDAPGARAQAEFSHDGSTVAVVTETRAVVADGRSGELLYNAPIPKRPAIPE